MIETNELVELKRSRGQAGQLRGIASALKWAADDEALRMTLLFAPAQRSEIKRYGAEPDWLRLAFHNRPGQMKKTTTLWGLIFPKMTRGPSGRRDSFFLFFLGFLGKAKVHRGEEKQTGSWDESSPPHPTPPQVVLASSWLGDKHPSPGTSRGG